MITVRNLNKQELLDYPHAKKVVQLGKHEAVLTQSEIDKLKGLLTVETEKKRSCFTCRYFNTCYVQRELTKIVQNWATNIDGDAAPGKLIQVFKAMGNCCLHFQKEENKTSIKQETANSDAKLPLVTCRCEVCNNVFQGEEPKMCCSGRDCGCMGLPIDPVVCSDECYDKL